ncbi:MAG: agmatine deiminase family protein [Flavitalea sp.]
MKPICTIFSFIPSAFLIIALLYTQNLQSQISKEEVFTMPAEFEKHEAIWMAWKKFPDSATFKNETVFLVLKTLTPYIPVKLLIEHDSVSTILHEEFKKRGIDKSRIQMFTYGSDPYRNLRDPGPVFLKSNKGNLMVADMKWNFYGHASSNFGPAVKRVDTIDQYVATKLNLPIRTSTLVSEGGAREFNGRGTMMVVEYTEMHRNKGWSRDSIENELLRMFGQKKIIWLRQGTAEDDNGKKFTLASGKVTTRGCNHIDEFARFASPNTVLLAEVTKEESLRDSMHKISYERLEANYQILKAATDQDGKPFKIIRMPVPELIVGRGGGVFVTSYLNFLITNGLVLTASYWKPGRPEIMKQKDKQAKNILEKAFPGRKVIAINVEAFNVGGGGIHCATQQQPTSR